MSSSRTRPGYRASGGSCERKQKFRAALAEVLDQRVADSGVKAALPPDQLALTAMALANGLAFEEVSDPGVVPDDLLGGLLDRLLAEKS